MSGDMANMQVDAKAAGIDINVKTGCLDEDVVAAEVEEEKKAEEAAAADDAKFSRKREKLWWLPLPRRPNMRAPPGASSARAVAPPPVGRPAGR